MKKRSITLYTGAAAALVAAYVLVRLTAGSGTAESLVPYEVTPLECQRALQERGFVVSRDKVPVAMKASSVLTEIAENGTAVKKGDIIFTLDDGDLIKRKDDEEEGLKELQSNLEVTHRDKELTSLEMRLNTELENEELRHAELEERLAAEGMTKQDRRLMEIDIALAELSLEDAQNSHDRQKRLVDKEFAAPASLDVFDQRLKSAQVTLENLLLGQRIREEGEPEERLLELAKNVERAEEVVKRREQERERKLEQIELEIEKIHSQLRHKKFSIERITREIDATQVPAPADGMIQLRLRRDWRSGGRWVPWRVGNRIWHNDIPADIIDSTKMQIDLMIHEADVHHLKEGMEVSIALPAYPDKTFKGRLENVSEMGMDRYDLAPIGQETERSEQGMFGAVVIIETTEQDFRPGMSAAVVMKIDTKKARLVVPRNGVFWDGPVSWAWKRTGLGPERVDIEGEVYDENYFLVRKGLVPGDTILLGAVR